MATRDRDPSSAMLNSKLIHMRGQMVPVKRYDSSTSLADSGHGSSMSSRWSSRSSLHSNASLISNNSNTSRLRSFFGRSKIIVEEALKKFPKKDTPKKPKTDNQNRIGGNNFSQKPLSLEGAAEQDTTFNEIQVDFKEEDVKLVPDNQCQIDSNGRRRKTSSSDSTKSYESESSNGSMQTFYNHDTQQDGHGSTEFDLEPQSNNTDAYALESNLNAYWAQDEQQSLQTMQDNHSMQ